MIFPILGVICFSSYGALGKDLVSGISPTVLTATAHGFNVLLFVVVFGFLPELKKIRAATKGRRIEFFIFTLLSGAVGPFLFLYSLQYTTAVNAMLLMNTYPLFMLLYSVFLFKQKIKPTQYVGMTILLSGIVTIILGTDVSQITFNRGDFLIIIAEFLFCTGDVICRRHLQKIHPHVAVIGRNAMAFVAMSIISVIILPVESMYIPADLYTSLFLFAIIAILLAQSFWYRAVKISQPLTLAKVQLLHPLFGVTWAWFLLGESLYFHHFIGSMLVLLGLAVSQYKRKIYNFKKVFHFHSMHHPYIHNGLGNPTWKKIFEYVKNTV
jgi:drug/metabolite transporter (DMT)-like permease